jgi:alkane 1-monooxygenase
MSPSQTSLSAVPAASTPLETFRIWCLHLLCFVLPVSCLAFGWTAPHEWWTSVPFLGVVVGSIVLDMRASGERRQPAADLPGWPFDAVLYALVATQLASVALYVGMVAEHGFWRVDTFVGLLLVGINSGYSAIVVAHELVHRKEKHLQNLGRLLLGTVLYDHFAIEHVRGHHSRVGTPEDPATARFGETAVEFLVRTIPAQFRSAWKLELRRLGDPDMRWSDPRMLKNRMLHGIVGEWGFALALLFVLGPGAFFAFVLQAAVAVRLLEAVNYFEHYGLMRTGKRVRPIDSWDTDSWFTLYTLVGLSRHADHHANASRPYQQLRFFDESPKLRYGYFGTVTWLIFRNKSFRAAMEEELRSRRLGPFAAGGAEAPAQAA